MAQKTSSPAAKETRARSWRNGKERRTTRKAAQEAAQAANRASASPIPWERAKAVRKARRAADPEVQRRARLQKAEVS